MSTPLPVLARTRTKLLLAGVAAMAAFALLSASQARADIAGDPSGDGVQPTLVDGNPKCADLNSSWTGWSTEDWDVAGVNGSHSVNGGTITISNATATLFDWSSTFGIDAVIVKGGDNADSYVYDPEDLADTGLHAPAKDDGTLRDISHAEFCYDNGGVPPAADLTASKTAAGSFERTYEWDIQKEVVGDDTKSSPVPGTVTFDYKVTVTNTGYSDGNYQVTGSITVNNPNVADVTDVDVSDAIDGDASCSIDSGGTDETIAANSSESFDYTCTYNTKPDGIDTNTATVEWTAQDLSNGSHLDAGSVSPTADVDWSKVTDPSTKVDECVDVSDQFDIEAAEDLGTACVADSPKEFTFSKSVDVELGCLDYDNTATFVAQDTQATGSDTATVTACGFQPGKTMGFWGNTNGQALLASNNAYSDANRVTLGASPGCYVTVSSATIAKKILPNTLNGMSVLANCSTSQLDSGINANSMNTLLAQTLALSYNIKYISGFAGQTLGLMGCASVSPLTAASTVEDVRDRANYLISNAKKSYGAVITQTQIGQMNTLLGCLNAEA